MGRIARSPIDVMLGEMAYGVSDETRFADLQAIASVISNRALALSVSPQQVVANQGQFNAYGKSLPAGASAYRELAEAAWDDVQTNGPTHAGTFYATPAAVGNLPSGLNEVDAVEGGHRYFEDPQGRAIKTSVGLRAPIDLPSVRAAAAQRLTFEMASISEDGMATPEARPDDPLANAVASNRVAVAPVPIPTVETWSAMAAAPPVAAVTGDMPNIDAAAARLDETAPIASPEALAAAMSRINTPAANPIDINRAMDEQIAASVDASAASKTGRLTGDVIAGIDPGRMQPNAPMSAADQALQGMMKEMATPNVIDRFSPHVAPARAFENITMAGIEPGFTDALMSPSNPVVPTAVQTQTITPGQEINSPEALAAALGSFPGGMMAQRTQPFSMTANPAQAAIDGAAQQPTAEGALGPNVTAPNFSQAMNPTVPGMPTPSSLTSDMTGQMPSAAIASAKTSRLPGTEEAIAADFAAEVAAANPGPKTEYDTIRSKVSELAPDVATPAEIQNSLVEAARVPTPTPNPLTAQPSITAVPAPALETIEIAKQPTIAPPVDDVPAVTTSVPSVTKSMPAVQQRQSTAMDVWGGRATTGTATDGSTLSRLDDGRIGRFDPKFNQTMFSDDDGSTWSAPVSGNQLSPSVQPSTNQSLIGRLISVLSGVSSPTGVAPAGTSGGMSVGRDGPAGSPGGYGPGGAVGDGSAGGYGSTGGKDPEGTH